MNAIEAALAGLIDYAGLYPPAALDMDAAVGNYLDYLNGRHAWMLGRFIVDLARLDEFCAAAGAHAGEMRLSVIAPPVGGLHPVERYRERGLRIEALEVKCDEPLKIARTCENIPPDIACYFEIPVRANCSGAIDAIAAVDVRAKLRMGGVTADAFPAPADVASRVHLLADRKVAFKATAGLHHPLRSTQRLTYADDSPQATMHGFINLLCAAAVVHFGGSAEEAARILELQSAESFHLAPDCIAAAGDAWTTAQIRDVRKCFTSVGSCSFLEPIHDLEALGWL